MSAIRQEITEEKRITVTNSGKAALPILLNNRENIHQTQSLLVFAAKQVRQGIAHNTQQQNI